MQFADAHHFPVIVFEKRISFAGIIQDLHRMIASRHYQSLRQMSVLSKKFNELSLTANGILNILQEIYKQLETPALFLTEYDRMHYYPPASKELYKRIYPKISHLSMAAANAQIFSSEGIHFVIMPVKGLGQIWGYLCLKLKTDAMDAYTSFIMEHAVLAISQIMLRTKTMEENKRVAEEEVARKLLTGKDCEQAEMKAVLPGYSANLHFRVILLKVTKPQSGTKEWEETLLQLSAMMKNRIKKKGMLSLISAAKDEIAAICFFKKDEQANHDLVTFSDIHQSLVQLSIKDRYNGKHTMTGISKAYKNTADVCRAYDDAKKVIFLQQINLLQEIFYDKIGIYQILLLGEKNEYVETFIYDQLGPVLEYDAKMNASLLTTLEVYLKNRGRKKETANELFIVRQTLYHRLEKIEELLGYQFMEPARRLALETAILAYHIYQSGHTHFNLEDYQL